MSSSNHSDPSNSNSDSNPSTSTSDVHYSDLTDHQLIGQGSFGKVYRADYLGTDVAVKECFTGVPQVQSALSETTPPDWDFDKYLRREVSMLRYVGLGSCRGGGGGHWGIRRGNSLSWLAGWLATGETLSHSTHESFVTHSL